MISIVVAEGGGLIAAGAVYRGGGITAPIGVRQLHARGGIAARGGGHDAGKILLRESEAIHHHCFGGDVGSRDAAVADTFRICIINTPLR